MVLVQRRVILALLSVLLLALLFFPGCGTEDEPDYTAENVVDHETEGAITLRLIYGTDYIGEGRLGRQINTLIRRFERKYENVEIVTEAIPEDVSTRDIFFKRIRAEILAGDGPDLYLMPTYGVPSTMLFSDVNQVMRNDVFLDISEYYDADTELGKEGLNTVVMDAGVVNGARYTLPLRFDYLVAYVDPARLEEVGLSTAIFDGGIQSVLDAFSQLRQPLLSACANFHEHKYSMSFFPEYIDYENEEILVSRDSLIDFLDSYAAYREERGERLSASYNNWFSSYYQQETWIARGEPMRLGGVQDAIMEALCAKAYGVDIEMFPITGSDGSLTALVNYYGAVGASCEHPALAYEFLRDFISEDSQWERNVHHYAYEDVTMVTSGYAVRSQNSVVEYFQYLNVIEKETTWNKIEGWEDLQTKLRAVELEESDVSILQTQIDRARYPAMEQEFNFVQSFRRASIYNPGDVDVDSLADNFLRDLQFHLGES